jgi:hypothetical protein
MCRLKNKEKKRDRKLASTLKISGTNYSRQERLVSKYKFAEIFSTHIRAKRKRGAGRERERERLSGSF